MIGYVLSTDDKPGRTSSDGKFKKSRGSFKSEVDRSNNWHSLNYRVPLDAPPALLPSRDSRGNDEQPLPGAAPMVDAVRNSDPAPKKRGRPRRDAEQIRSAKQMNEGDDPDCDPSPNNRDDDDAA